MQLRFRACGLTPATPKTYKQLKVNGCPVVSPCGSTFNLSRVQLRLFPPRLERDRLTTTLSAGKVLTEKGCMGHKKGIIVFPVLKIIIVCFFVFVFLFLGIKFSLTAKPRSRRCPDWQRCLEIFDFSTCCPNPYVAVGHSHSHTCPYGRVQLQFRHMAGS